MTFGGQISDEVTIDIFYNHNQNMNLNHIVDIFNNNSSRGQTIYLLLIHCFIIYENKVLNLCMFLPIILIS